METTKKRRHSQFCSPFNSTNNDFPLSERCAQVSRTIFQRSRLLCSFPVEEQVLPSNHCCVPRDTRVLVQPDPYLLVAHECTVLANRLQGMIVAEVPKVASDAEIFFKFWVKKRRLQPTVLLLMAAALDIPTTTQVLEHTAGVLPKEFSSLRQCIPEVAEMMHIYNLLRHDIRDNVNIRYHVSSFNFQMGTKLSVLVGDVLLSKIFVILASLKNFEVQSLLFMVLEHLVMGETMEMTSSFGQLCSIDNYLERTYNRKASLLANSCKATAVLSKKNVEVTVLAYDYGKYLGFAYQLMDDILDLDGRCATSANQSSSDLSSGMLGAPMLFAIEEFPQLLAVVDRGFKNPSEMDFALECLKQSQGIQRTRKLAVKYARLALTAIETLPKTDNKDGELSRRALADLAQKIIVTS